MGVATPPPSTESRPVRSASAQTPTPSESASAAPQASSAESQPSAEAAPAPPAPDAPLRIAVRFLCDEKYVAEEACDEVSWLAEIANDPDAGNLLDHDAGGPDGAIWNGNAPMVVIAPGNVKSVSVGNAALSGGRFGNLRIFRVPPQTWNAALRAVPGKAYRAATVRVDGAVAGEIWYAEGE